MDKPRGGSYYNQSTFEQHCLELAVRLKARSTFDLIIGLETGGAFVAAMLTKLLGVPRIIVLDVAATNSDYRLGPVASLDGAHISKKRVLCVAASLLHRQPKLHPGLGCR